MSPWWRILIWSRKCQSDQAIWYLGNTKRGRDNRFVPITPSPLLSASSWGHPVLLGRSSMLARVEISSKTLPRQKEMAPMDRLFLSNHSKNDYSEPGAGAEGVRHSSLVTFQHQSLPFLASQAVFVLPASSSSFSIL